MMDKILQAVYDLYNITGVDLQDVLTGGLWLEHAMSADLPYATYMIVDGRTEYWLNNELFELPRIQFDIYAETHADRISCYEELVELYDDAQPSATGYNAIIMERAFYQFIRDGDQNQIFRAIVEYECRWGEA